MSQGNIDYELNNNEVLSGAASSIPLPIMTIPDGNRQYDKLVILALMNHSQALDAPTTAGVYHPGCIIVNRSSVSAVLATNTGTASIPVWAVVT
ncbi:MAG: hypothetical protein ACYSTZ_00140 [Planctomycetota bacterium]|jgi:hypothetical protein